MMSLCPYDHAYSMDSGGKKPTAFTPVQVHIFCYLILLLLHYISGANYILLAPHYLAALVTFQIQINNKTYNQ